MTPDEKIELYRMARAQAWAYRLSTYDRATLQDMQRVVKKSQQGLVQAFGEGLGREGKYTRKHFQGTLKEMERMSLGLQQELGEQLTRSTSRIGSSALKEWSENISVGGIAKGVNNVALSPEQFRAFFTKNPPHGILIPKVIRNAFDRGVVDKMQGQALDLLRQGALGGESYERIISRLGDAFTEFSDYQLNTLTRTFFQTANAQAFDAVYEANADIIEGKIWQNSNDDRVCLLCLPLGGMVFKKGEPHPEMPRHPNCRCVFTAKTVSYRDLGIDVDELDEVTKPVVTRGYEKDGKWVVPPVGKGRGGPVRTVSFYKGGMKEAFPDMPAAMQKRMLGAKRYEMYKAGTLSIDGLIDKETGRLKLLDELKGR